MVNYLTWVGGSTSAITAVSPFTYRDGVTYLEKLEGMGAKVNELVDQTNYNTNKEATDVAAINAQYTQLVADWNATLATLDPTAVHTIVTGYDTQIAGLNTRVTAVETVSTAQATAITAKADKTYVDAQDTVTLNSANTYTDTAKTAANTYTDTAKTAANAYTDTQITGLSATYETKAAVPGDATAAVANALSSATAMRDAFDARYAAQGTLAWPAQGKAGGVYYLSAYCNAAQKAGTASASPAVAQIMSEMSASNNGKNLITGKPYSGGTIIIDGKYLLDQPIVPVSGLSLIGTGTRSSGFTIQASGVSLLQLGNGVFVEMILCDNFGVDLGPSAGSFLKMTGTDGASYANQSVLTKSTFRALRIVTQSTSAPIVSVTGYSQYHSNNWYGFEMDRPTASTVPLMDFQPNAGNIMNSNCIQGGWLHGHNTTGAPAIRFAPTAAGWCHNWTLEDLCGEQNCGGFIWLSAINHVQIRNCVDWDGINTYTAPVIRVGKSSAGTNSGNVYIGSSGVPYDLAVYGKWIVTDNGTYNSRIEGCNPCGTSGKIQAGDMTAVDGLKLAFRSVTANYTATAGDELMLVTVGGITITLPDPLTIPNVGVVYKILNLSGAAITVVAANGRTVAGGASLSVPAGGNAQLITEGQYMSASGAAMRWISF